MLKYKKNNVVYFLLKKASGLADLILRDKKRLMLVGLVAILFFYFLKELKEIFFILALTSLGALSLAPPRYFKYAHYVGFELCLMATVLTSLAYGPVIGALAGFISIFTGFVLSSYFKPTYFISVLAMPLMGLIVPIFRELPLFYLGVLMTLIYDAIVLPLYVCIGSSRTVSAAVFFITHILLNAWVFSALAPFIYNLMV
ncbi:hypothetical protein JXC34_06715 [Candidatus Woesearchaeota archaeon]|nr:hypothetical protein [Candidatus Woesearchaeota archaeon]